MKLVKIKREINLIKKAAEISNSCLPLIEKSLHEKITEKELRRRINRRIRSQHASLSFQTIVACGKRSAKIHPKPRATNKIIKGIGYVDFGACYKGYKSDVTVPFIKGKISKRERKIVEITLKAYNLAINSIKINEPCWKLFEKINNFMKKNGFELKHGLGHGLGLKIHEYPFIVIPKKGKIKRRKKRRWKIIKKINFQPGMVFTIEPAVYVNGLGGCRIENDILLTKKGPKILTKAKLIEV
jgi:Xaa-Pro aminopeptidase